MSNHEEIKNITDQDSAMEDYDIKVRKIKGGFWLEEYINKQNGLAEKAFIKNSVGNVIEFVDWEALEKSEPFKDFIKAHYLNEGMVLSDEDVKRAAESFADAVSNGMLNGIDENRRIAN